MFIDRKNYLVLDEFAKFGIMTIFTDKTFGDATAKSKDEVLKRLNIKNKQIVSGHQTHSENIRVISADSDGKDYFENTDGFITDMRNIILYAKYGDCLPIFLLDTQKMVIGVLHSGWKGTFAEIGIKGIDLMGKNYGSLKEDILIGFGVGISWEKYEVSIDFYEKFSDKFEKSIIDESFIFLKEKIYFDNQKFNRLNFLKNGISDNNIITNDLCTYRDKRFFSYRRERNIPGRNAGIIYIKQ
ncbi:MAG: peptidoglycan editing factor PgeF [Fusobacteriaceae bacterium]|jgi:YfiH family protein|nr:peptidoglycan editing factor PgeF [Fusobacteriaceae bacterium]